MRLPWQWFGLEEEFCLHVSGKGTIWVGLYKSDSYQGYAACFQPTIGQATQLVGVTPAEGLDLPGALARLEPKVETFLGEHYPLHLLALLEPASYDK